jgi:hypothetical protein
MSTAGPSFPGTAVNDSSYGVEPWSTVNNIKANDNSFADNTILAISNYLKGTNFGFNLPTDSIILGISLDISRKAAVSSPITTGDRVIDNVVQLLKSGVPTGANKALAALANRWPTIEAVQTYGGPNDLWGVSWTPADINISTFGVVLAAAANRGDGLEAASVNYFSITIYYNTLDQQQITEQERGFGVVEYTTGGITILKPSKVK